MGYRIGSFNVKKLSFATKDENLNDGVSAKRDYDVIGSIITDNFSIVALQEVLNENVIKQLRLPSHWKYKWSKSYSKISDSEEGYAFAWDTRRIQLISEPIIWKQYRKAPSLGSYGLLRHPFYGRFKAIGPNSEFRLINTHIRFNPKKANEDLDIKALEARRKEFEILSKQILNNIEDRRYGDYMPAYTMLLGDYNLNLNSSSVNKNSLKEDFFVIQDANCNKKIVTVQDKLTTLKCVTKTDYSTGKNYSEFNGYANNYDHFTYNETYFNRSGIVVETDIIDTVSRYSNNDFEHHYRKISDHVPIMMEINLK